TSGSGNGANLLFRIAHVENLRIFVNVPQTFVRSIVPGQEVRVLVPEYPQRPFVGKIASTAGALDATSRTLLTEVRLRNDDHALMPGMYAQVKFSLAPADDVWVVRGLSEVRDRRRAHRGIGIEVPEPRAVRRRAHDHVESRVGEDEDVPDGARDLGRRPALLGGLRDPRLGRPAQGVRRAAPRPA